MIKEVLARTIALAKLELESSVPDETVLDALTSTNVRLVADHKTMNSLCGQIAVATAAQLIMRSGHKVEIEAKDAVMIRSQPPLGEGYLIASLQELSEAIFGYVTIRPSDSDEDADLVIYFGNTPYSTSYDLAMRVCWTEWSGSICKVDETLEFRETHCPIGALTAANLATGEAFKASMQKLRSHARTPLFDRYFARTKQTKIAFADEHATFRPDLGEFDIVSGGAVTNALLYALLHVPSVSGSGRIIEFDVNDTSNQNRNMLLQPSALDKYKAETLASFDRQSSLNLSPIVARYDESLAETLSLHDQVLVGVDDIPSRWLVQKSEPSWLAVGATEGFAVQTSIHTPTSSCVGCVHPSGETPDGSAPTAAFVSFWAGLQLAAKFLLRRGQLDLPEHGSGSFFTALRPEAFFISPIPPNAECPLKCEYSSALAA